MNTVKIRVTIALLTLSAAGFVGILTREGYTDNAVIPVKGDVPTYGFGTTAGVKLGDKTNPVQAVQRALMDAGTYEGAIKRCVTAPLTQGEYDLWVHFAYNVGPTGFCTSTIVKLLNALNYAGACEGALAWKYVKGFDCSTPGNQVCAGLWSDRLKTHKACLEEL